jgi:ATP-dependent RNA helicase MSS116
MQDHLDNTPGFARRIEGLSFLVLDEADQLLETGFRDAILKILKFLPSPKQRQGALFSATFPAAVNEIAKLALKPDHAWVDTVTDEVTPDQIAQSCAISDIENMTETLWGALSAEMVRHPKDYKIMVFFVAARITQLYSEMFNAKGVGVDVHEIHSRKSQGHRTKAADTFRSQQKGIVFSSDVLARGLDFPDVTAVIQVGGTLWARPVHPPSWADRACWKVWWLHPVAARLRAIFSSKSFGPPCQAPRQNAAFS